MASLKTSGLQRFVEKILAKFLTKKEAQEQFLTQDNIDIEDVALKSKDIFGKNSHVTGSSGSGISATTYPSGLVPSSAVTSSQISNEYLRGDGTWHTPFMVITGKFSYFQANHTDPVISDDFNGTRYVEIFASDGSLVASSTVDPNTNAVTRIAVCKGYVTSITSTTLTVHISQSGLEGNFYYTAFKFD